MWPVEISPEPRSSFQQQQTPPASDPNAGVLVSVCYARSWLGLILGALQQLAQDTNWNTTDENALALAQARTQLLLDMFMKGWCELTTGMIAFFAGLTPPDGWLEANGQAISRACYAELFAVCGEQFGAGDGETTFNLPNLSGRVAVGTGEAEGGFVWYRSEQFGHNYHQLTTAEMPSHTHPDSGHSHGVWSALPSIALTGEEPVLMPSLGTTSTLVGYAANQNTGGDGYHLNLQPGLGLMAIIKT